MALAERRQRERDQRREDIINAAEKLFFSRGYDNVSMDEIASEVELSKPALYYYFKDKESLFFAVVNRGVKIFRDITTEELKNSQTSGLKVGAINLATARFNQEYPDYAKAHVHFWSGRFDLSNDKDLSPDAKEIIEFSCENYRIIHSIIKNGIEDGTFRSDANPLLTAVLIGLISIGIPHMSPSIKTFMETHGITAQQFNLEVADLAYRMVMHIQEGDENIRSRKSGSDI
ncbi:TPA: TetR/AcrR family transcriptional regulator [Methanosarcina acetivorans]|uniref:Transcriptional regulator, TetR family n=2 Tax=Methanosarcina acetivorans TaxID=2214 RepID=Q8TLT0_METAC|nr:TetR/AcrR family transcriptional regulator [Methanosarcina acetivorans]AAM06322.1 transcriptional regulator, TetR family [Methanosarcina acetivorans C2A]HIH95410.1 TetR/AcrR family transcriptional regulator [Methanosarcina acetivorans]